MQPASDAGSYLVMGSDFGRAICVQYGTANIVAVPVEAGPGGASVPPQFVNTGLPEFARCLALLGRMWRLRFGLNQEQAGRWTVDFQAQLAALDPAALGFAGELVVGAARADVGRPAVGRLERRTGGLESAYVRTGRSTCGKGRAPGSRGRGYAARTSGSAGGSPRESRSGRRWLKRLALALLTLVLVVVTYVIGLYFWGDSRLRHADALNVRRSPSADRGADWLLMGPTAGRADPRAAREAARRQRRGVQHRHDHGPALRGQRPVSGVDPEGFVRRHPGAREEQDQRGVRARRSPAPHPHRRTGHRAETRPLRRGELPRLRRCGRLARRRDRIHVSEEAPAPARSRGPTSTPGAGGWTVRRHWRTSAPVTRIRWGTWGGCGGSGSW